jgi:hypothetical protein
MGGVYGVLRNVSEVDGEAPKQNHGLRFITVNCR